MEGHDGEGARRGTLEQDTLRCVSPPNDQTQRVFVWSGSAFGSCKVLFPYSVWGGVGTVGKSDETGIQSGLLVAFPDRDLDTLAIGQIEHPR